MSVYATRRIASLSSVARNRAAEAQRAEVRGDEAALTERLEAMVSRFESLADEMEAALR
jgi:molybdenum-dependent DNA-binding transcriptional regulator ModE